MTPLSRANGQTVTFQDEDLISTLNSLKLSNHSYVLVNNVFMFRLGPGSGRLLLADASQANRDLETVFAGVDVIGVQSTKVKAATTVKAKELHSHWMHLHQVRGSRERTLSFIIVMT